MQHSIPLADKFAIVTGGASGLGLAIANTLAKAGAHTMVFDCNHDKLQQLPDVFQKALVDVTDKDGIQSAIDKAVAANGKIDILINNAGVIYNEPFINLTKPQRKHDYDTYKKIIDVNMHSVFLTSAIVAEQMILKRTQGIIVNMSSISAEGNIGQTAYSAAKAGVNAFTKTWAKELGPFGIRVVAIAPGFIEVQSTKTALSTPMLDNIVKKIPLRRLGNARDVAETVLSVVCNQYINGTVIEVNGGLVL